MYKSHKIIKINSHKDLHSWSKILNNEKPKIFCFDMDGVLVGDGMKFPAKELKFMAKSGFYTTIATNSGISNVINRINASTTVKFKKLGDFFTVPLITNGGAYLINNKIQTDSAPGNFVMKSTSINKKGIEKIIVFIKKKWDGKGHLLFYPALSSKPGSDYSPFKYVVYINPNSKYDSLKIKDGFIKSESLVDFLDKLKKHGANKFVVRGEDVNLTKTSKLMDSKHLTTSINIDYSNVDVLPTGINKKASIETLWKDILKEDSNLFKNLAYFGNDFNDEELLKYSKIGVIVESLPDVAKSLANIMERNKKLGYTVIVNKNLVKYLLKYAKTP